jgi:hypothetical protein
MIKNFIVLLLSILVLLKFQQSCIDNKNTKNKYETIFNNVKIPLFFISLFLVFYSYNTKEGNNIYDTIVNQQLYTSNPNF